MNIEEIMTKNPAKCTVETSLHDVAQMMADNDCGCIPVVETDDSSQPIGTITDRDIVLRTVAHNKNPLTMIVGEVMTDAPITATADTTIEDACTTMEKNHIRRLLVVDDNGDLCGILAQADVALSAPEAETAHLVKEVSASALKATA
ncbi:MAG: CBS domain-containing protein [Acidobacteria bacterium]|nr:MAG: CBS domain-containing protein [Acidobacteriota bacterium]REK04170.1 MAG: CBS domain-containing protein [Acidobacteriota bacterium]REK15332.1 MAG: CBS domain-containing protein [Acidobacteriota bacterium]REK46422.1 MAG: CBS domain-containing protein [Acidobacteriota bacterium]